MSTIKQSTKSTWSDNTTLKNQKCQWIWLIGTLTVLITLFMLVDNKILTVVSYFGTQGLWTIIQTLLKQNN
jgi:uncharacterized integral membrane protein